MERIRKRLFQNLSTGGLDNSVDLFSLSAPNKDVALCLFFRHFRPLGRVWIGADMRGQIRFLKSETSDERFLPFQNGIVGFSPRQPATSERCFRRRADGQGKVPKAKVGRALVSQGTNHACLLRWGFRSLSQRLKEKPRQDVNPNREKNCLSLNPFRTGKPYGKTVGSCF